LPEAENNLC